jgi:eukaryotic-like serine/threonine-protein kinase
LIVTNPLHRRITYNHGGFDARVTLNPGTRLGPYEVAALIGKGGMGEVYRAHDTKLNRDVALKVLPARFALDADRLVRFQREAQVLASLNHPNIAIIHRLEEADGVRALVLELVEGPTLSDRIAKGPLPLDEALSIARQVADALEAAHEHGIIHRDLKPANIKVREDGTVKVLDFGLAKALDPAPAADLSQSPTMTSPAMTGMGVILGTAAYMSPEQAKGKSVDKRADIWAFGCVLYEMLSGKRAFDGDDVSDMLATVLKSDPNWNNLPSDLPPAIRRLLRRCLTKDLKGRIGDASIARIEIDEVRSGSSIDVLAVPSGSKRGAWIALLSALALVTLIAAMLGVVALRPVPSAPEMRVEINTPPTTDPFSLAISPDGQKLVFVANSEGRSRLWLRSLDSVSAQPLAGTDRAWLPFWSPDSRSVGFFADTQLKRIDIGSKSVQALATVGMGGLGGTWNLDGAILFSPGPTNTPIFRIPDTGGAPAAVTRLETHQQVHYSPEFLPDGRHFLYYVLGSPEASGIYVGQLEGSPTRRLLDADAPAVYASSGHLLFVRQGTLFAQHFDPGRLELTGDPFPVAERVTVGYGPPVPALSASAAGPLVYRSGSAAGQQRLAWFDRSGKELGKAGGPDSFGLFGPSLSPDGRRVALFEADGNVDVWLLDLGRNTLGRFTTDAADDVFPIWSPDSTRIVFSSNRKGTFDLYQKPPTGAESEQLLLTTPQAKLATDWSLDGRFLLYHSLDPNMSNDIWALPLGGDRKPFPVVQTMFDEGDAQFSPDGKWIAYQSNESGRFEIYVQPFPGPGSRLFISTAGGYQARWGRDGKELFYIAPDNQLMAVPIRLAANGQAAEAGAPVALFGMRMIGPVQNDRWFVVSRDGQQFLVSTVREEATSPITVILNWKPRP